MNEYQGAVTVSPRLVSGAFEYWVDGNHNIKYSPPLITQSCSSSPFVVRVSNKGWVPLNVIVFAVDGQQAKQRVIESLRECAAKDYHGAGGDGKTGHYLINGAHRLLREIESGELNIDVALYPLELITKVSWASNDTVT